MAEPPIYESRRTAAGLWQRYLVYRDHVELRTMFGLYRIRMEDIEDIWVSPSLLKLMREKQFGDLAQLRAAKLDSADFKEHVALRASRGLFRVYRFTPDDPAEFVYAARSAARHFPKLKRSS